MYNAASDPSASNDWVFSIDSDECVTSALVDAISEWDRSLQRAVGQVLRVNFFMGRAVTRGDWGNDRLVRLFHRKTQAK